MEWPYSPIEEESLYNLLSSPNLEMPNKSSEWTYDENKLFENLLAEINPASPDFFEKVASKLPWKTMQQIKNHYQSLVDDVEMIESGNFPIPDYNNNDDDDNNNNNYVEEKEKENDDEKKNEGSPLEVTRSRNNGGQRRRGVPWTEEEHQLFLMGLNKYGKGDWRSISRYYVISKTPTQVASHAQKYFRRQTSSTPIDRRRPSIHDIQTVNPTTSFTPSIPQISNANNLNVLNQGFNGGINVLQNPNFNFPINPNFPSADQGGSMFNQSASNGDYTTSFLFSTPRNQPWG